MDCPNCAAKIEEKLQSLDFVYDVSLNFAANTLTIDTKNIGAVQEIIDTIEPGVTLSDSDSEAKSSTDFNARRELLILGMITVAFILALIFKARLENTPYQIGAYLVFIPIYLATGWKVLYTAGRNIRQGQVFDEHFLMSVATIGAVIIGELPEAVGVMLFYQIGEFFQDVALNRSRRSIQSLMSVRPDYAHLQTDAGLTTVSPEAVEVGQTIVVKPGEKVPLDGTISNGESLIDNAVLTGESVPLALKPGDDVLAGGINKSGTLTIRVNRPFGESSIAKIMDLVENATAKKTRTEKFITKFARFYSPAVVFLALGVAFLPPIFVPGQTFTDWIYRALVLLVISCPCALVVSIPLSYFGGIGGAARRGILVKGSNFLDVLADVKTVVFDKTGTITHGVFEVSQITPENGFSATDLLHWGAHAEAHSNHPIAQSIREAYGQPVAMQQIEDTQEIGGRGIRTRFDGKNIVAGNDNLLHDLDIAHHQDHCTVSGTVVHLAVDNMYAGHLIVADRIKETAKSAMQALKKANVRELYMLTGDSERVASEVARAVGMSNFQANLLPEDKLNVIEDLLARTHREGKIAFVGDGVNDTPVIARADVGIAMGALGSDAAIETADVVIMDDSPLKVAEAIHMGRKTRRIVWQNIGLALGIKGLFILFGIAGMATMWEAVFADVGVALLAVFNALRVMRL